MERSEEIRSGSKSRGYMFPVKKQQIRESIPGEGAFFPPEIGWVERKRLRKGRKRTDILRY